MNHNPFSTPAPSLPAALGGIWRLTYPRSLTLGHLLSLVGLLALLGAIAFAVLDSRNGLREFPAWIGRFHLTFLVPVLAFLSAAGVLRDDVKPGTVDYVLTRPVPRPAYVLFKYITHVMVVQLEFLLALGLLAAIGFATPVPAFLSSLPHVLVAQVMLVFAFSAFGFLCAVLTSRYAIIGLLYGAVVEVGVGEIPTQLNRISMTHHVNMLLKPLYEAAGALTPSMAAGPAGTVPSTVGTLSLFTAVALALAATIFSLRELAAANES